MKGKLGKLPVLVFMGLLSACATSAHNPFNPMAVTDSTQAPSTKIYPSHANRVRVSPENLPAGVAFEVIGTIDTGSNWYGGLDEAKKMMADRAREMGADAVVEAKEWHQPSGFSWAAPHGSGVAVKLVDPTSVNLDALPGGWF